MSLSSHSLRNPIAVIMAFTAVIILGLISLSKLDVALFPNINYPQVTVVTSYTGASPAEIEQLVTSPIEEAMGVVEGLKSLESYSREGKSLVIASFRWDTDMALASMRVREKLDLIRYRLPREADEPVVMRFNPLQKPVMVLNVTSDKLSLEEMRGIAQDVMKEHLEKTVGVASVQIVGGRDRQINVLVDQQRLASSGYNLLDAVRAIKKANLDYPAGAIEDEYYEYLLRVVGRFKSVDDIAHAPLFFAVEEGMPKQQGIEQADQTQRDTTVQEQYDAWRFIQHGRVMLLQDIATVEDGYKEPTSYSRFNGQDALQLTINQQSGANVINVAEQLRERLLSLPTMVGDDIDIEVIYDQSDFIQEAISSVAMAAVIGGILALIVLWFFLGHIKRALIITIVIPISLLATFIGMYFMGISLNVMSLGGLALTAGMLIDSGIVVLENMTRWQQKETNREQALIHGCEEVFTALLSSNLTTIAVFLPVIFVSGLAGQFFKELAITVSWGLMVSLVVSTSLVPVLFSMLISTKNSEQRSWWQQWTMRFKGQSLSLAQMERSWHRWHRSLMRIAFIFVLTSIAIFPFINKELLPRVEQHRFIVDVIASSGATLERTIDLAKHVEAIIQKNIDVTSIQVQAGSDESESNQVGALERNEARLDVRWQGWGSTHERVDLLRDYLNKDKKLHDVRVLISPQDHVLDDAASSSLNILLQSENRDQLNQALAWLSSELKKYNHVDDVLTSRDHRTSETQISVNRDRASALGLNVTDVALLARTAVHGQEASAFRDEAKEIDIMVRLNQKQVSSLAQIEGLNIYSEVLRQAVPLKQVATLASVEAPHEIYRLEQNQTESITAQIDRKYMMGIKKDIKQLLEEHRDRFDGVSWWMAGEDAEVQDSFRELAAVLLLSVIFVYMIMASQFQSYGQPLLILSLVPISLSAVCWFFFLGGLPINVIALLGAVMLSGIVVNNGIILVDFINQSRREKMPLMKAVYEAVRLRFRPIMMTTITTVFGLLPMMMASGPGTQIQSAMANVVCVGLSFSLVVSLIFLPALYIYSVRRGWLS